jgi:hypothetical protein
VRQVLKRYRPLFHPIRGMEFAPPPGGLVPDGGRRSVGQTAGFQEAVRGVALIGEGFAEYRAGLGLTVALLRCC